VRDKLTQERPPGRDRGIEAAIGAVAHAARGAKGVEQPLVARETRERSEQPCVAAAVHGSAERPAGGETVISRDGGTGPDAHFVEPYIGVGVELREEARWSRS
jgi:hypothetical protein